jgi:hypothetical protein
VPTTTEFSQVMKRTDCARAWAKLFLEILQEELQKCNYFFEQLNFLPLLPVVNPQTVVPTTLPQNFPLFAGICGSVATGRCTGRLPPGM